MERTSVGTCLAPTPGNVMTSPLPTSGAEWDVQLELSTLGLCQASSKLSREREPLEHEAHGDETCKQDL